MIAAVLDAADDATLYVDDAAGVSDSTSVAIANFNRTSLGVTGTSTRSAYMVGEIDGAMIFTAALTSDQIAWLYNSGDGRSYNELSTSEDANNPGIDNLAANWSLTERSGTRADQTDNELNLTEGYKGNVNTFASASSQYLTATTAARTALGFTMACWFKSGDEGNTSALMDINDSDAVSDYALLTISSSNAFTATSRTAGPTANSAVVPNAVGDGFHDDAWHFGMGVFHSDGTKTARIDAETANTQASAVSWAGTASDTSIGAWKNTGGVSNYLDGEMSYAMIWDSELSQDNHDWLYNSGDGRSLYEMQNSDDADNPGEPDHLLKLDNDDTPRPDSIGSLNLAEVNSVSTTTGAPIGEPVTSEQGIIEDVATLGSEVIRVIDLSGNGNDLVQSDFDRRPTVVAIAGPTTGYAMVTDGVDDYMSTGANFTAELAQPNDIFMGVNVISSGGEQKDFFDGYAAAARHKMSLGSTNGQYMFAGTVEALSGGTVDLNDWHLHLLNFLDDDCYSWEDGTARIVAGDCGPQGLNGFHLASRHAAVGIAYEMNARYGYIVINDGALTTAQRNAIATEVASIIGSTWTDIV
jgi:hypothetical protein